MMWSKNRSTAKSFLVIWIVVVFECGKVENETCQMIDDCTCKKSNGKIISLKDIDGGSKGPAFKDIPTIYPPGTPYKLNWNPCTKFSEGDGCEDMLVCQTKPGSTTTSPCAKTVSAFQVNRDGSITILYKQVVSYEYHRTVRITLKCDASRYPGETDGVNEDQKSFDSNYTMTFKSKCACNDGCASSNLSGPGSSGLSIGSMLLIAFFVLLLVYLAGGIVFKKYKMGVESMPEMVPNYGFWSGLPSLVKDGVVFTCQGLKFGCISLYQKCSKDSYAEI